MKNLKKVKTYTVSLKNNISKLCLLKQFHSGLNSIINDNTLSDKKFGEWLDAYLD